MERSTGYKDSKGKLIRIGDIISYSGTDSDGVPVKDCTYYIEEGGFEESFGMSGEEFLKRFTCKVIGNLQEDSIEVEIDLN